jgi:hypothetical protein
MPKYIALLTGTQPNNKTIAGIIIVKSRKSAFDLLPKLGLYDHRIMLYSFLTPKEKGIADSKPILYTEESLPKLKGKVGRPSIGTVVNVRMRLSDSELEHLEKQPNKAQYLKDLIAQDL